MSHLRPILKIAKTQTARNRERPICVAANRGRSACQDHNMSVLPKSSVELARSTQDDKAKAALLQMAQVWFRLTTSQMEKVEKEKTD